MRRLAAVCRAEAAAGKAAREATSTKTAAAVETHRRQKRQAIARTAKIENGEAKEATVSESKAPACRKGREAGTAKRGRT